MSWPFWKLQEFIQSFYDRLIVESDSSDVISWLNAAERGPRSFHFYFNEFKSMPFQKKKEFKHLSSLI